MCVCASRPSDMRADVQGRGIYDNRPLPHVQTSGMNRIQSAPKRFLSETYTRVRDALARVRQARALHLQEGRKRVCAVCSMCCAESFWTVFLPLQSL